MKKIRIPVLLVLGALLLVTGCQKDSSADPSAITRASYLGSWGAKDTDLKLNYEVVITADSSSQTAVFIQNFAGIGSFYPPARAFTSGSTITLVPNQTIGEGIKVSGSGSLSGTTTILWNYTITIGVDQKQVSSTYTKH